MEWSDRYKCELNRRETEKRLKELRSIVLGTNISILPFICTKDGRFSNKKAYSFIEDLISQRERKFIEQQRESEFKQEEKDFYRAFFYCTIRCFANQQIKNVEVYEKLRTCTTFQDILDKARLVDNDIQIKEENGLCDLEFYNFEYYCVGHEENPEDSFFVAMDLCYRNVTGKDYKTLDEDAFDSYFKSEKYSELMEYEQGHIDATIELEEDEVEKEIRAQGLGYDSYEELEQEAKEKGKDVWAYIGELTDIDYDNLTDEEAEELFGNQADLDEAEQYINELNTAREPEWKEYFGHFVYIDEFVDRYKEYRKLFFKVEHENFCSKVEEMIFGYMYEKGLSIFIDNDASFSESDMIDNVNAQLNAAIERIRRKYGIS